MKPLLFAVGSATSYKLHKAFAAYCVAQGRSVAFLYDRPEDDFFETITVDAAALGAPALSLDALIESGPPAAHWPIWSRTLVRALRFERIRRASTSPRVKVFSDLLLGRLAAADKALARLDPAVLIVGEDGISGPAAIQAAARRRRLKVIDLPYGYGTQDDLDISLEAKESRGELIWSEGVEADAIHKWAPAWIKRGRFAGSLMFPPEYIAVSEAADMGLDNAWIVHGGHADRLLVESNQMLGLYRSEGIPAKKLVLTGSPYCDILLEGLSEHPLAQAALRKAQRIEPNVSRILVSWPPSYHDQRGDKSEFATYLEMTQAVLGMLSDLPNSRLTVSLHPAVPASERQAIAALGVDLSDEYVVPLIPRHDIFVNYFSSTVRWAIAAGKPVVNYDAYKLDLDVYAAAPGVVTSASLDVLKRVLGELVSSEDAFSDLAKRQVAVAADWGILDGQCMARILAEIDKHARH